MITLIAAIGRNNEIGFNNSLLWHIPEDLAFFKQYTSGKTIVMGRSTYESIGRPLPNRTNVVLSNTLIDDRVLLISSIHDVVSLSKTVDELVIIGGGSVYSSMIPFADRLIITHIDATAHADSYFPEIGPHWSVVGSRLSNDDNYSYTFTEYHRL